jgi:hypothetical protein
MKKILLVVAVVVLFISFLISSFYNYFPTSNLTSSYNFIVSIYYLILLICSLYISFLIINNLTKFHLSLANKIVYSFMINFSIFGLILIMWIFGGNVIHDDKGLATTLIIIPSVIVFAVIGFVIGLILSTKRRNITISSGVFKYKFFSGIFFVLVLFTLLFVFSGEIFRKVALTLNNESFCPSLQSPLHSNCVDRIIKIKAIKNKDIEICLKSSTAGYCVMEVAWSTGDKAFCEYLEGGSMFKKEFYMDRLDRNFCISRR